MKVESTTHVRQTSQKKLNYYLQTPTSYNHFLQKQPNLTVHNINKQSRLKTSPSQPLHQSKQFFSSSFYDSFQFVDRLTNDKLIYKDARKSSSLQSRKSSSRIQKIQRTQDKGQLHNLMQIYKKTKMFQMKSLKKRIFKHVGQGQGENQPNLLQSSQNNENKRFKHGTMITSFTQSHPQQLSSLSLIQQSRKKNNLRSFIDKSILDMNKAQLKRISTQGSHTINQQIMMLNHEQNQIKSDMDQAKIDELIYIRERQQHQEGRNEEFVRKEKQVVFKEVGNVRCNEESVKRNGEKGISITKQHVRQQPTQKKKKRTLAPRFEDTFMQKMMIHAKSYLKKQGQYLINPTKQKIMQTMLLKKSKLKSNGSKLGMGKYREAMIKTEIGFQGIKDISSEEQDSGLDRFSFQKRSESELIKEMKAMVKKNSKQTQHEPTINQHHPPTLIQLLKSNLISSIALQLAISPFHQTILQKDQKQNNLLHLAVKHDHPQVLQLIFMKAPYKTCIKLLNEKNNAKRTPQELARLLVNKRAIEVIQKYHEENKRNRIVEGWIDER